MKRFNFKLSIWISVLIFIFFSEIVISYLIKYMIPAELIIREPLHSIKSVFNFSLIFKFLPFIILSVILGLYSIRFKYRFLIWVSFCGFIGLAIPWVYMLGQLSESWLTSLNLSSTSGLAYLVLPVFVLPIALAGIFLGLSGLLLRRYFNKSATFEYYKFSKSRITYFVEGFVYLILGVVIVTGSYLLIHPYFLEDRASSVLTRQKKLEKYYIKGRDESNINLLSSLASNPKLPLHLIEEIYDMASGLRASDDKLSIRLFSSLAENIKSPAHILASISEINNSRINRSVALNPGTPVDILKLLSKDGDVAVKIAVSRNPNTPSDALTLLSGESHYVIRRLVARHKNVTKETLMYLTNDADERVKSVALEEIAKK